MAWVLMARVLMARVLLRRSVWYANHIDVLLRPLSQPVRLPLPRGSPPSVVRHVHCGSRASRAAGVPGHVHCGGHMPLALRGFRATRGGGPPGGSHLIGSDAGVPRGLRAALPADRSLRSDLQCPGERSVGELSDLIGYTRASDGLGAGGLSVGGLSAGVAGADGPGAHVPGGRAGRWLAAVARRGGRSPALGPGVAGDSVRHLCQDPPGHRRFEAGVCPGAAGARPRPTMPTGWRRPRPGRSTMILWLMVTLREWLASLISDGSMPVPAPTARVPAR
jgi:hypothetical protein